MIFQTLTTSFKKEVLEGVHDFLNDSLKIALYESTANLGPATTGYSVDNEVSGGGYTAGGVVLSNVTINTSGTTAYVSFDNPVWSPASFVSAGALIYNASKANRSVAVLSFGADKTAVNSFTIEMPPNTADSALIRFT
jgi:hypothetical protein